MDLTHELLVLVGAVLICLVKLLFAVYSIYFSKIIRLQVRQRDFCPPIVGMCPYTPDHGKLKWTKWTVNLTYANLHHFEH